MIDPRFWSMERCTGFVLVLGFSSFFAGASMYWIRWIRSGVRGGPPPTHAYFVWERSLIMAAVVLTAIGLVLLEGSLENTDGSVLARMGATAYLFGGVLWVIGEASSLTPGSDSSGSLFAASFVLAFLAQSAIGASLLQTELTPAWVGWATMVWNLGWLGLGAITRGKVWIPMLPHLMPFVIGIALLSRSV